MQLHEATPSQIAFHEARKAREASHNAMVARLAASKRKPTETAIVLRFVNYPQADAHCKVWTEKQAYNAAKPLCVVSVTRIQTEVVKHFGIAMSQMADRGRLAKHVYARQIAFWLAKHMNSKRTLNQIACKFGMRDHTTVLHGIQKIEALINADPAVAALVAMLERRARA